jgi:hypothetical protein
VTSLRASDDGGILLLTAVVVKFHLDINKVTVHGVLWCVAVKRALEGIIIITMLKIGRMELLLAGRTE